MSVVAEMGKFTTVTTGYAIKETPASQNAHIVVGTAGTLLDQLSKGVIDPRKLKVFVLDEADNMLEKGTLGDQTLRVKKSASKPANRGVLTLAQSRPENRSNPALLSHISQPRAQLCHQICAAGERDHAEDGRAFGRGDQAILHGLHVRATEIRSARANLLSPHCWAEYYICPGMLMSHSMPLPTEPHYLNAAKIHCGFRCSSDDCGRAQGHLPDGHSSIGRS